MLLSQYDGDGTIQTDAIDPFGGTDYPVYRKYGFSRFGVTNGTDVGTLYYGGTYTFSVYLRLVTGLTAPTTFSMDICDRNDDTNISVSALNETWQRFYVTATHDNSTAYHFIDMGAGSGVLQYFEWSCPQIERKDHVSTYIDGTKISLIESATPYENTKISSITIKGHAYDVHHVDEYGT